MKPIQPTPVTAYLLEGFLNRARREACGAWINTLEATKYTRVMVGSRSRNNWKGFQLTSFEQRLKNCEGLRSGHYPFTVESILAFNSLMFLDCLNDLFVCVPLLHIEISIVLD